MNIGELDSRIEIYRLNTQLNSYGEEELLPVLLKKVWAKVEPRTGSLMTGRPAGTMLSKTTHAIYVRAESLTEVETDCYIMWSDAIGRKHRFDIDYILPPVRSKRYSTIYVQEVV